MVSASQSGLMAFSFYLVTKVVKTASDLIFIKVQTFNYGAVDISDRINIRLSRNQTVELSWSAEFTFLGTISIS